MASDRLRKNTALKIVVLDSSAIFMIFEYSINLEQELLRLLGSYEVVVPSKIIKELKFLCEKGKGKQKKLNWKQEKITHLEYGRKDKLFQDRWGTQEDPTFHRRNM